MGIIPDLVDPEIIPDLVDPEIILDLVDLETIPDLVDPVTTLVDIPATQQIIPDLAYLLTFLSMINLTKVLIIGHQVTSFLHRRIIILPHLVITILQKITSHPPLVTDLPCPLAEVVKILLNER